MMSKVVNSLDIQRNYIEKEATNYIKGIAIVLMFFHHFFTFPEWYIEGVSYPYLAECAKFFCEPTKICVPVFAFLTGYFYFYSNKSFRYSIRKATDLWISYLFCFFVIIVPIILLGVYEFSISTFVLELFALKRPTMVFCWYVVFYITSILLLPFFSKICEKSSCFSFMIFMVLPSIASFAANLVLSGSVKGIIQIVDHMSWFPCIGIGYIFAKHDIFFEFLNLFHFKNRIVRLIISFLFISVAMIGRYVSCPAFICAPFFVFGVMEIYYIIKHKSILIPLKVLGKYSLLMWFLHCIFFNQLKEYTQPVLYFPRNPVLVTIWGLLICLIVAVVLQIPIDRINKLKNKMIKV